VSQKDTLGLDAPFDQITALLCSRFDAPFGLVSIVHGDHAVFRSEVGLGESSLPRDVSVSNILVAMGPGAHLVIEDARAHPVLKNHPMVAGSPFLRFFAGATISNKKGEAVGAVGVMDSKPRPTLSAPELETLSSVAAIAGSMLEQATAQRLQAEQLALLTLAEEMSGVGHWRYDVQTGEVAWSDEVFRIHGLEPGAINPCYENVLSFYHPDDAPVVADAVQRALTTGEGYKFRLRLRPPGREERLVDAKAKTEQDEQGRTVALFGVFQDVTKSIEVHERVARSEERYRLLAENATDIIATYGMDGVFRYVSPAIMAVMGYRPDELAGQPFWKFMHPEDVQSLQAAFTAYAKAGPGAPSPRLSYRGVRKDGQTVWLEAHPRVIRDADGKAVEFQDVVRDVTATKALEDQLIASREVAEAGARAKSEFLANMSHELRTPLTSVIGFSGLLQQSAALPETERRYVDRISTASEALLGVINDILDYSKLEAGAVQMEARAFDPRTLAQAAAAMVEGQCEIKGLTLAVVVDPAMPAALTGDEGRLRQVMLNFLANAVKFTARGGVTLQASWTGERLRLAIRDTGIGIAVDKIESLFERFSQADSSTTRVYGGTGLGLSISRRLVEMMGGEIGAESRIGEGSTFWFEVPLTPAKAIIDTDQTGHDMPSPEGLRILVADDAAANRELVVAILGGLEVAVDTVEDGVQAVEAARTGDYDLILMDVHMPVMDGLGATRAIRALEGEPGRVPIVALTANVQPEQAMRCLEAGMDDHVGKPIQVAELLRVIAARLDQRASLKADAA
jgi:PAS domain S-box-containing protein